MSCLAAPPAAPPKAGERMLRAVAPLRSPSPCRGLHYAVRGSGGREAGCGRLQLALLRCSPAGESRASGDGGLSRLLHLNSLSKSPFFQLQNGSRDGVVVEL
jgi:hypothetical protein